MRHSLDIVAVGVEYKRPVIMSVVMRPKPRRAVIAGTGSQCRLIKGTHFAAIFGGKCHVQAAFKSFAGAYPELRPRAPKAGITILAIIRKLVFRPSVVGRTCA